MWVCCLPEDVTAHLGAYSAGGSEGWYVHNPTSPLSPHEAAGVVWGCLCSIHHLTWAFFPVSVCTGFQIPAFSVSLPVSMVHDCVCALSGHPRVCMNESTCLRFRHACRVWFMGCWGSNPGILHAREALYQLSYTPSP